MSAYTRMGTNTWTASAIATDVSRSQLSDQPVIPTVCFWIRSETPSISRAGTFLASHDMLAESYPHFGPSSLAFTRNLFSDPFLVQVGSEAYEARIAELKQCGEEDGAPMSEQSLLDFRRYVDASRFRRADLYLRDNGNLLAVWRRGKHNRLDIEFFGSDQVRFLIFKQRQEASDPEMHVESGGFGDLERNIREFELHSLLTDGGA